MTTVNIYLTFNGNCEEAFNFYRSVFGGEFGYVGRFGEMPPLERMPPIPDNEKNKIMHISLPVSKETCLMGCDSSAAPGETTVAGNNFSITINGNDRAEADRLFSRLSEGGKITLPMDHTFWGSYYGLFTDKFGINWMINFSEDSQGKNNLITS
ncbi:MAG: VOC family protein [Chitinophagaceae bacterium]|nr:VOC family protein [Chitinophagaceae bacterium]MCW5929052.1 VOC family protein [Chitinophagaceae bacterium]